MRKRTMCAELVTGSLTRQASSVPRFGPKKPKAYETRPSVPDVEVAATPSGAPFDLAGAPKVLAVHKAAEQLGMSPAWVRLHARELGGELTPKGWLFPETITLERVTERVTIGRHTQVRLEHERHEGSIAADVFEMLNGGSTLGEIVIALQLHPKKVLELTNLWVRCGQASENELAVIQGRRAPPGVPAVSSAPATKSTGPATPLEQIEMPEIPGVDPIRQERDRVDIASLLDEVKRVTQKEDA